MSAAAGSWPLPGGLGYRTIPESLRGVLVGWLCASGIDQPGKTDSIPRMAHHDTQRLTRPTGKTSHPTRVHNFLALQAVGALHYQRAQKTPRGYLYTLTPIGGHPATVLTGPEADTFLLGAATAFRYLTGAWPPGYVAPLPHDPTT